MSPLTIVIAVGLLLDAIFFYLAAKKAPFGHQDKSGFHNDSKIKNFGK